MKTSLYDLRKLKIKKINLNFNIITTIMLIFFLTGLILGSLSVKNSENVIMYKIIGIYESFLKTKNNYTNLAIFLRIFLLSVTGVTFNFFNGLSATGIPFATLIPLLYGTVTGIISGYTYEEYLLKGLGFCAVILFPTVVISILAIIYSCKESILMSKNMVILLSQGRVAQNLTYKTYCSRFLIFVLICLLSATIGTFLFYLFSKLFVF